MLSTGKIRNKFTEMRQLQRSRIKSIRVPILPMAKGIPKRACSVSTQSENKESVQDLKPREHSIFEAIRNEWPDELRLLLKSGVKLDIKSSNGWSLMDCALLTKNKEILSVLFDALYTYKIEKWVSRQEITAQILQSIPNFYIELYWRFTSKYIPLVSSLAPSDTVKIWKIGPSIRIDCSLVGWKKLRSKRRNMSLLLVNGSVLRMANHSKQFLFDPFEAIDEEEREAVLQDLVSVDPIQGKVSVSSYSIAPLLSKKNQPVFEKVNGWDSQVFKASVNAKVVWKKSEETKSLRKNTDALLWTSNEFPVRFADLMIVLDIMKTMNLHFQKFVSFIENLDSANSFPVKADIPITLSIRAQVSFKKCEIAIDEPPIKIPNYPLCPRKTAQKTLKNKKKRMILMNFVI